MKLKISLKRQRIIIVIIVIIVLSLTMLTCAFFHLKHYNYVPLFPQYKLLLNCNFLMASEILSKTDFRYRMMEDELNFLIHPDDRTKALLMLANLGLPSKIIPLKSENSERSLVKGLL